MKAQIKADRLKEIQAIASVIVDECKFTFSKKGLGIKAVDPAHVAMLDVTVSAEAFEKYECPDILELGLDLDKIQEVVRLAKNDDVVSIEHDATKNSLIFKIGNLTRRMQPIDSAGMSDPKVPNLTLPNVVVVKTDEIKLGFKASSGVSDHIILECAGANECFRLRAEGDTDTSALELSKDQLVSLDSKQASRSLFPSDYFGNLIKVINSPTVTIEMGNNYPCKIIYNSMSDNCKVNFLLAPRIESE